MGLCWSGKECMMNVLESEHLENKDGEYMPEHVSTFRTCVQVYLEWLPWLMLIFTFISHFVIDLLSI